MYHYSITNSILIKLRKKKNLNCRDLKFLREIRVDFFEIFYLYVSIIDSINSYTPIPIKDITVSQIKDVLLESIDQSNLPNNKKAEKRK